MKMIIIDLREENELYDQHLESENTIFNIPTRHIQFNVKAIKSFDKVYLICRTSGRSDKVKTKYFAEDNNVISVKGGLSGDLSEIGVTVVNGMGGYGFQQKMQMVFVLILLLIMLLVMGVKKMYVVMFILLVMTFITSQIVNKSCLLSKYLLPPI